MPAKKKPTKKKAPAKKKTTAKGEHQVVVYTAEWCPWCHRAKDFLKEHKIAFVDKDVEKDQKAAQEMVDKSGQMGIPVVVIDKEVIVGYDRERIAKLLGIKL